MKLNLAISILLCIIINVGLEMLIALAFGNLIASILLILIYLYVLRLMVIFFTFPGSFTINLRSLEFTYC